MINRLKLWLIPSLSDVLFISILLYFILPPDKQLLADGDTGYHIRTGDYILNTFKIPKEDIFSYQTPALPWTAHEWLSEVLMSIIHQVGGLTAVVVVFSIIIAASTQLFYKLVKSEGNNIFLSVTASIAFLALAQGHFLARPHIFSLIILIAWYRLIDDFQYRNIDRLNILPLITITWVNLHGGFIIGLTILAIYLGGNLTTYFFDNSNWSNYAKDKTRRIGIILSACLLSCIINPIGYNILLFPFKLVTDKYIMDHTNEFLSPNFHDFHPFKYVLLLLLIVFAYSKRKPNLIEITLSVLFTSMSLYSVRYIPLFAVIVIPIILRYINGDCISSLPRIGAFLKKRADNFLAIENLSKGSWTALSLILVVSLVGSGKIVHEFDPKKKPLQAIKFLKENQIAGNMFNNDEFGDFLIYLANQQYKVFIDGRLDMYGTERLKDYGQINGAQLNMDSILDKYHIDWSFIETDSLLARILIRSDAWRLIYSDKLSSIFIRNSTLNKSIIDKYPNVHLADTTRD